MKRETQVEMNARTSSREATSATLDHALQNGRQWDPSVSLIKRVWPLVPLLLIVGGASVAGALGDIILRRAVINALIMLIIVTGLYVFTGLSGILSFGHISFMAIGAYGSTILTIPVATKAYLFPDLPSVLRETQMPFLTAILFGVVLASVFAWIMTFPVLRFGGIPAALVTLSLLVIVHEVAANWETVTRGTSAMTGVPLYTSLTWATMGAVLSLIVAHLYQRSRGGRRLAASREDERAAASVGVNIKRERRIAFVLSASIVALAGALWAHFVGTFAPDSFYFPVTFITIAALIVGGTKSLAGAVLGTVAISVLTEGLRRIEAGSVPVLSTSGMTELGLAAAIILILILRPRGITNGREFEWGSAQSLVAGAGRLVWWRGDGTTIQRQNDLAAEDGGATRSETD